MGGILWTILSIVLGIAFIGVLIRLIVGFGSLVLSAKIFWIVLLVVVGIVAIVMVRKALQRA